MECVTTSFLDALRSRYGAADDSGDYEADAFLVGDPGRRRNKRWELVGMEQTRRQQSDHSRLVQVVLRGMNIAVSERVDGELEAAALRRLQEVDLSENPQLSVREIGRIVRHLPALTVLQASEMANFFDGCSSVDALKGPCLLSTSLRKLVLNNVGLCSIWQLRRLVDLPALEELHLDNNGIRSLTLFTEAEQADLDNVKGGKDGINTGSSCWFPNVTALSLAGNELSSWKRDSGLNITLTTAFPRLTRLFLSGNRMPNLYDTDITETRITTGNGYVKSDEFAYLEQLELLCLNNNLTIDDPCTLEVIRKLCPHLHTFRITYRTLFPQWNETLARMYVVASLPNITTLNRGHVRTKERLDSEIFYVQRGLVAKQQQGQKELSLTTPHYPLLEVLQEKHKDVIMAIYREGGTASNDGFTHRMLHLTLRCDGFAEVQKVVPSSITVGKLKALMRAIFGVFPANQEISFFTGESGVIERAMELDNELQTLDFYGVCDRAVVQVVDTSLRR